MIIASTTETLQIKKKNNHISAHETLLKLFLCERA